MTIKKKKRKKSTYIQTLESYHKAFVWPYIMLRDNYMCFTCGKSKIVYPYMIFQVGHMISRGKKSVFFHELNNHVQCAGCNKVHNTYPEIYISLFLQKYGEKKYQELVTEARKVKKYTILDLENLADYYTKKNN